jgi:hypothetical protein
MFSKKLGISVMLSTENNSIWAEWQNFFLISIAYEHVSIFNTYKQLIFCRTSFFEIRLFCRQQYVMHLMIKIIKNRTVLFNRKVYIGSSESWER